MRPRPITGRGRFLLGKTFLYFVFMSKTGEWTQQIILEGMQYVQQGRYEHEFRRPGKTS